MPDPMMCSQTVIFLDGNKDYLDRLREHFLKALGDGVHLFTSDVEMNEFLIIADGPGGGVMHTVREIVNDFYHEHEKLYIKDSRNLGKNYFKEMCCIEPEEETLEFVKDNLTVRVYSRDDRSPKEVEKLLFEFVSKGPKGSPDNPRCLFDLIGAKKHEVFFVCKLSAIQPFYSICEYEKGVADIGICDDKQKVCLLSPFPAYVDVTERQFNLLRVLYLAKNGSYSSYPDVELGFLTRKEALERAGYSSDSSEPMENFFEKHLIEYKNLKSNYVRARHQYRITDDGIFTLYRVANSKGWKID